MKPEWLVFGGSLLFYAALAGGVIWMGLRKGARDRKRLQEQQEASKAKPAAPAPRPKNKKRS